MILSSLRVHFARGPVLRGTSGLAHNVCLTSSSRTRFFSSHPDFAKQSFLLLAVRINNSVSLRSLPFNLPQFQSEIYSQCWPSDSSCCSAQWSACRKMAPLRSIIRACCPGARVLRVTPLRLRCSWASSATTPAHSSSSPVPRRRRP